MLKYFYIILLQSAANFVFLPFLSYFFPSRLQTSPPSPLHFSFHHTTTEGDLPSAIRAHSIFQRDLHYLFSSHNQRERSPSAIQRTFYRYLFFVSSLDGFDCKLVCFWLKMEFLLLALSMGLIVDLIGFLNDFVKGWLFGC
jgi:hypothetical protein